jgi:branched-chain amino acid transport system permease protein
MSVLTQAYRRFGSTLILLLLGVIALLLPWLGINIVWQREIILIAIYSIVVSGLNVSFGYAGELALGQVALFAIGAYLTGYMSVHGHSDLLLGIFVGALAAGAAGLITGIPGVRLGAWSLGMVSFFLVLLIPDILQLLQSQTGGLSGLTGIAQPTLLGHTLSSFGYYLAVIVTAVICFLLIDNFLRSRHGIALKVLRQSPILAQSLGMSVSRAKVMAYIIGGIPAGIAGALFAYLDLYLAPQSFGFNVAVAFLAASILGGRESVLGAIVGSTIVVVGPTESTAFQQYALVSYGVLLLLGTVLLLGGYGKRIWGLVRSYAVRLVGIRRSAPVMEHVAVGEARRTERRPWIAGELLKVDDVSRSFGGVAALSGVSLSASPGRVTAIIGPNGSGKTTLLNLICGFESPDAGTIVLGETTMNGVRADLLARKGVGRTFQTPFIPTSLTAAQVVSSARFSTDYVGVIPTTLRTPRYRRAAAKDQRIALETLESVGLGSYADDEAASLPLGTRRILELARAAASEVKLLLLDEPASGLDEDEIVELERIVRSLRDDGATVILVEHNFPMVMRLADEIHVLALGKVLVSGTPDEIRADERVIETYLGVSE